MSAEWRASSGVETFAPRRSRVEAMPERCRDSAEPRTSSRVMPATKREDILRPMADRSEKLRRVALRERAINVERKMGITSLKMANPPFSHSGQRSRDSDFQPG